MGHGHVVNMGERRRSSRTADRQHDHDLYDTFDPRGTVRTGRCRWGRQQRPRWRADEARPTDHLRVSGRPDGLVLWDGGPNRLEWTAPGVGVTDRDRHR